MTYPVRHVPSPRAGARAVSGCWLWSSCMLATGLVFGSSGLRWRADPSASRRRQGDPPRRLDARPRQPQPVHRDATSAYEIWRLNYDFLTGYAPISSPRQSSRPLGDIVRRQDLDVPPARGRQVAGRRSLHRHRRRVHLQLHRQQRHGRLHRLTAFIDRVAVVDDLTVEITLQQAQGQHDDRLDAHPPRAHLEQGRAERGCQEPPEPAAHYRDGPVPDGGGQEGRLRAHGRQPLVLGARSRPSTRSSSSPTRTRTP